MGKVGLMGGESAEAESSNMLPVVSSPSSWARALESSSLPSPAPTTVPAATHPHFALLDSLRAVLCATRAMHQQQESMEMPD
jgi:hypothetical protein